VLLRWRAGALLQVPTCADTNGPTADTPAVTCPGGWTKKTGYDTTELTGIANEGTNWRDTCCDQVRAWTQLGQTVGPADLSSAAVTHVHVSSILLYQQCCFKPATGVSAAPVKLQAALGASGGLSPAPA